MVPYRSDRDSNYGKKYLPNVHKLAVLQIVMLENPSRSKGKFKKEQFANQ